MPPADGPFSRCEADRGAPAGCEQWAAAVAFSAGSPRADGGQLTLDVIGIRACREFRALAECLHALLAGNLSRVWDIFVKRFVALETSVADVSWATADLHSLPPADEFTFEAPGGGFQDADAQSKMRASFGGADVHRGTQVRITSHRLLWHAAAAEGWLALRLDGVASASIEAAWLRSKRCTLRLRSRGSVSIVGSEDRLRHGGPLLAAGQGHLCRSLARGVVRGGHDGRPGPHPRTARCAAAAGRGHPGGMWR
ncbi:unnamed protein product [Prorocentrum cordatum]|uniref:Uncharacterized protein n=1 Tax=Prorocentrum cordatum TaxID=2364126 RepID=A0ABN9VV05_9DINO|nr:unnamed protein product [Polarella glacialis]